MTGSRDVRGRRLFSDRRGRLSLQVYTMRALIRERGGYREANKSLVGVGAHDDPETIACCERPFVRHLERSEAESKFAKWSVRNGANRANNVSERSKNDYR